MIPVLLGIGSNIEAKKNIIFAMNELRKLDSACRFSRVFESKAQGFDGENVFNLVAKLDTPLPIEQLVNKLKQIELISGRNAKAKEFSGFTLDIDLLTYGSLCQTEKPQLPRKAIYKYPFVLLPLAQLCPNNIIPGDTQTYAEAWSKFEQNYSFVPVNIYKFD